MRTALRVLALLLVTATAMAQTDDALRIRAAICTNKGCTKRALIGFAPATVRVEVYITQHPGNRAVRYGLSCDGVMVQESLGQVDGDADPPVFVREYQRVWAGECVAVAALARVTLVKDDDGRTIELWERFDARSTAMILKSRLGED